MKTITLIVMLLAILNGSGNTKVKISSRYNCATSKNDGKCTGSAYCTVCKNCSRCGHCSNGGSCGVCGGSSGSAYTSTPKKKSRSSASSFYSTSGKSTAYYENETITVSASLLNVRENPTLKSKVLVRLTSGDQVVFIQKSGDWSKIKVKETGTIGYVFSKLLK